jgi:hypothetical protein
VPKLPSAIAFCTRPKCASRAKRPRRRLAPRARELVVELGVLEVRELERQRLLEDHLVDALPSCARSSDWHDDSPRCAAAIAATSRLRARRSRSRARDRRGDAELPALERRDDGIDDQRADIRDGRWQDAGDQRQQRERDVSGRLVDQTSAAAWRV